MFRLDSSLLLDICRSRRGRCLTSMLVALRVRSGSECSTVSISSNIVKFVFFGVEVSEDKPEGSTADKRETSEDTVVDNEKL